MQFANNGMFIIGSCLTAMGFALLSEVVKKSAAQPDGCVAKM
jgi:mannose/fructose/N-acetylgalactosamine-specific phosphotransferase system component IIC